MNQDYVDTVRLLLAVAPAVFHSPRLALKGGTALNLFVQDMPRLSVDLDVVFTDHTLDRESARALTPAHREFLLSLVRAEPAWELMPYKHLSQLPALQWKLLNLHKLKSRHAARFAAQHDALAASFEKLPFA
jgi:hypothetical protein